MPLLADPTSRTMPGHATRATNGQAPVPAAPAGAPARRQAEEAGRLFFLPQPASVTQLPAPVPTLEQTLQPEAHMPAPLLQQPAAACLDTLRLSLQHAAARLDGPAPGDTVAARPAATAAPPRRLPGMLPAVRPAAAPRSEDGAILFADIVGFTRLCEPLPSDTVFAFLRHYHALVSDTALEHGAVLTDCIGDGVMAIWSSRARPPYAECGLSYAAGHPSALTCALSIHARLPAWNAQFRALGFPTIGLGIGLHAGRITIGRTGEAPHDKLSAFGDAVNVANRLERMTRPLGADILASDAICRTATGTTARHDLRSFSPPLELELPGRPGTLTARALRRAA